MMTTMPPAVQNLSPAAKSRAPAKPEAGGLVSAADFRDELNRQRRADRPERQDPAASAKRPRAAKSKKKPEPTEDPTTADAAQSAEEATTAENLEPPTVESAEEVVDGSPTPDAEEPSSGENEPTDPLATAAAGSAAAITVPAAVAEVEPPTATDSPSAAPPTAVTVYEAITGASGQDAITTQSAEAAPADVPRPNAAVSEAPDDAAPVEENAIASESVGPRSARHATEDGSSSWQGSDGNPDEPTADVPGDGPSHPVPTVRTVTADATVLPALDPAAHTITTTPAHSVAQPVVPHADPATPDLRFAADNHENIVRGIRTDLLPNGGSMRIRLDPPQLGALQVTVQIRDGVVTAAFETTSDEATRLLGHSLNQLKTVLESQGVTVDKLQVQQAPRAEPQNAAREGQQERGQSHSDQEHAARQEQQRREMLRRMWRRLAGATPDPLDVTG